MKRWIIVAVAAVLLVTCAGYALVVLAEYRQVVGAHQKQLSLTAYRKIKAQALADSAEWLDGRGVVKSITKHPDGLGLMMSVQNPSGGLGTEILLIKSEDTWSVSNRLNWGQL